MNSSNSPKHRLAILLVSAWLILSVMQTFHFYYYFDQSLWNSVRWSFRDWFVWFAIFAAIYHFVGKRINLHSPSLSTLLTVALVAVSSGLLQVLIITSLDFIQGTATRPFWVDFWRFYNKRWFQYLFVFTVFWLVMSLYFSRQNQANKDVENTKIKVNDGKQTHWLKPSEIESIEAAGNYVCMHVAGNQIIVRSTIKDMHAKLDNETFIRVSRSNLVNLHMIKSCHRADHNKLELELISGSRINVGSTYKQKVKEAINL